MASWNLYLEFLAYIALLFFFVPIRIEGPTEVEVQFQDYLVKFNKTYTDSGLYQGKLQAFQKSLESIQLLNSNRTNGSALYGLTKFSDMLPDEFLKNHLQHNLSQRISYRASTGSRQKRGTADELPKKVDWRLKNAVTGVKNQRDCGACWAFSVVETVESMHAIKTGRLEELSVQEMIDCAGYENDGCDGGDVCSLLLWVKANDVEIHRESEYPLTWRRGRCGTNSSAPGIRLKDFACESFVGREDVVLELLARNGPVAVAINAQTWQNYIGGVIHYHCDGSGTQLNHAVQIVGYDLTSDIPHYVVKNTWGQDFGDGGYLYISVGENMCGIAQEVSALTVL